MADSKTGQFVWHEHMTKDAKAAIAFYTEVVGWKTQPFGPDYTMWVGVHGPLGGVMAIGAEAAKMGVQPSWVGSVRVDDVDAAVAKAKELGGALHHGPMDIPEVGRYAVLGDPQGAAISVFKPQGAMEAHDTAKPGEFCWNELMTSDPPAALEFYSKLFGWKKFEEMDMGPVGKYVTFGVDKLIGGIMKKPEGAPMPTAWGYYIEVADLDATVARATKMGAKSINAMEVPGGRMNQLIDPQGAFFALHQAKPT